MGQIIWLFSLSSYSKTLFQTQAQISLIFDSKPIQRQVNPDELGHCYVRSTATYRELSLKLIKSHHKSYIILCTYIPTCIIHSQTQVFERVSGRWQGHHYWDHWSFQWRSRTSLGLRIRRGQTDPEGHMVQRIECHLRYVISWLIFLHDLHII